MMEKNKISSDLLSATCDFGVREVEVECMDDDSLRIELRIGTNVDLRTLAPGLAERVEEAVRRHYSGAFTLSIARCD